MASHVLAILQKSDNFSAPSLQPSFDVTLVLQATRLLRDLELCILIPITPVKPATKNKTWTASGRENLKEQLTFDSILLPHPIGS